MFALGYWESSLMLFRFSLVSALLLLAAPALSAEISLASAKLEPIPDATWSDMQGKSYHSEIKGCAQRKDLVLLTVPHWDFKGRAKLGQMIVHKSVGADVLAVFKTLYTDKSYAVERMDLIDIFGGNDRASMTVNNTSAYNCRVVSGSTRLSSHARGLAIDINPFINPFVTSKFTSPPGAEAYDTVKERNALKNKPGMILRNSAVTKAFKAKGWGWGGDWSSLKDYQHFSADGK
jgi:D-alanyl-D-alanine carboxypeptidase